MYAPKREERTQREKKPSAREQLGASVHSLAGPQGFLRARVWAEEYGGGSSDTGPREIWP